LKGNEPVQDTLTQDKVQTLVKKIKLFNSDRSRFIS